VTNRRNFVLTFLVLAFMGVVAISNIAGKPRFQTFHTTDVLQLVGAGMCFGVGLVALVLGGAKEALPCR
jgi:hypothetical protein